MFSIFAYSSVNERMERSSQVRIFVELMRTARHANVSSNLPTSCSFAAPFWRVAMQPFQGSEEFEVSFTYPDSVFWIGHLVHSLGLFFCRFSWPIFGRFCWPFLEFILTDFGCYHSNTIFFYWISKTSTFHEGRNSIKPLTFPMFSRHAKFSGSTLGTFWPVQQHA